MEVWHKEGDRNRKFFHRASTSRKERNRFMKINRTHGTRTQT